MSVHVVSVLSGLTGHVVASGALGGYRPLHLVLAGIAVLLLAVITRDVIGLGVANRRHARRARTARRTRDIDDTSNNPDDGIGGVCLPDDPDLTDPNGLTGAGTPGRGCLDVVGGVR
jgi:hypothetical protein